ncbi:alpha/beta hydrolase [Alphaproteobacteria bacterium]|jgi:pimeloyl-ACP methyl ester carboxylesterase|nr:alpha/beta hydrolase [Alphaproteobacteria bacterium]
MLTDKQQKLLSGGAPRPGESAENCVKRFEESAEVFETPCGDGNLIWHKWGEGEPILMFHGNHGSWSHWIRNIPVLSQHYAVYCSDAPGLGDSALPPEPYSLDGIIDALALGIEQIVPADAKMHVVGFSYGSATAANTAWRFVDRVKTLTMCASARLTATAEVKRDLRSWRRLETPEERWEAHKHNLKQMMICKPEIVDDLAVHLQNWNAPRARIRTKEFIPRGSLLKALIAIKHIPIRNIWGTGDAFYPHFLNSKEELIDGNNINLDLKTIDQVGHWSPYEASEQVNEWLLEWFRLHD